MGHFTHVYDTTHGVIGYPTLTWVPGEGESIGITHDSSGNPLPDYKPDNAPEEGGGTLNIDLSSIENKLHEIEKAVSWPGGKLHSLVGGQVAQKTTFGSHGGLAKNFYWQGEHLGSYFEAMRDMLGGIEEYSASINEYASDIKTALTKESFLLKKFIIKIFC